MSIAQVIVLFAVLWWIVLLVCLPFGIERDKAPEPGMDPGAPVRPRLVRKAIVTTLVTATITAIAYGFAESGLFDLEAWLRGS